MWLGYCAFHVGDYKRSMLEYEALTHAKKTPKDAYLNLACIFFYLGELRHSVNRCESGGREIFRVYSSPYT